MVSVCVVPHSAEKEFRMRASTIGGRAGSFNRNRSRRVFAAIEPVEPRRLLSTYTVDTAIDVSAVDGKTSLREAIVAANAHAGADTIKFSSAVFSAGSLHTIALTAGQLVIGGP